MDDFYFSLKKLRLACRTESNKMLPLLKESIINLNKIRNEFAQSAQNDSTRSIQNLIFPDDHIIKKFRSYFQSVFQRLISKPRMTWSLLNTEKLNLTTENNIKTKEFLDSWLQECKEEIIELTTYANKLIEDDILKEPTFFGDIDSQAFFLKMRADYYRYTFEVSDKSIEISDKSKELYQKALSISSQLIPTNSVKLGIALNYSVLLFEDLGDKEEAFKIANEAFSEALKNAEHMEHNDFKESTLLMQLLRDNMTLWAPNEDINK